MGLADNGQGRRFALPLARSTEVEAPTVTTRTKLVKSQGISLPLSLSCVCLTGQLSWWGTVPKHTPTPQLHPSARCLPGLDWIGLDPLYSSYSFSSDASAILLFSSDQINKARPFFLLKCRSKQATLSNRRWIRRSYSDMHLSLYIHSFHLAKNPSLHNLDDQGCIIPSYSRLLSLKNRSGA